MTIYCFRPALHFGQMIPFRWARRAQHRDHQHFRTNSDRNLLCFPQFLSELDWLSRC